MHLNHFIQRRRKNLGLIFKPEHFPIVRFNSYRLLDDHFKQQTENTCDICSREFCTSDEFNAHQQQGCEGLIEIGSNIMDCKPTPIDWNSEYDDGIDENHSSIQEKHSKLKHKCNECGKYFSRAFNLSRHILTHYHSWPWQCWLCHRT